MTAATAPARPPLGLAIGATGLAFVVALCLSLPQPPNPANVALGALVGGVLIAVGFLAARPRPAVARAPRARANLAFRSLLLGALLGAVLLGVLFAISRAAPALRARFAGRLGEPWWRPWALAFESSILEEIAFRLFALGVIAWLVARVPGAAPRAFAIALVASSLMFGLAHLPAWMSATHSTPLLVATVLALNGSGGLLLGWIFWRWGLPYAILAHFAGDVVIQALGPRLLS